MEEVDVTYICMICGDELDYDVEPPVCAYCEGELEDGI